MFIGMFVDVLTRKYQVYIATLGNFDIPDEELFFISHLTGLYVFFLCMTTSNLVSVFSKRTLPEVIGVVVGYSYSARTFRSSAIILPVLFLTSLYISMHDWLKGQDQVMQEPWTSLFDFYVGIVVGALFKQI
jgi:hypothetical protein